MPLSNRPTKPTKQRLLAALVFSCRDMSRLASQSLDTRLPWRTRLRMRLHLLICRWCRRYRAQLALLRRAVSALGADTPEAGPALPSGARERIRKSLRDHGGH